MPNLVAHIGFGLDCIGLEEDVVFTENLGAFLLGCCSPDIRIVTKMSRDTTHFSPISNDVIGTGTHNLFSQHPILANKNLLNPETRSFLAGYILHLVADETWIITMYRPFFGNKNIFSDKITANIMDRAMQLDMDKETHLSHQDFNIYVNKLSENYDEINIDFISNEAFQEFTDRIKQVFSNSFDWNRLLFMTKRQYPDTDSEIADTVAKDFINNIPISLTNLYEKVPKSYIDNYRKNIMINWQSLVKEYLL